MTPWSSIVNYTTGPDTGTPTKTKPAYVTYTDGVGVSAQEANYLQNQTDQRLQRALNGGQNWTIKFNTLAAGGIGGGNAFTCAYYVDSVGVPELSRWVIGAAHPSGAGNSSAFITDGLADGDFVGVSGTVISVGGYITDVSFDYTNLNYLAAFKQAGGNGSYYKCNTAGGSNWVLLFNTVNPVNGFPRVHYTYAPTFVTPAIYAVYVSSGSVVCAVSTDGGTTFGNGFSTATSGTDVHVADNGVTVMVMTSDGAYHTGTLASWASFTNPFAGGVTVVDVTWSINIGAWFALTTDGTRCQIWQSFDGAGWAEVGLVPFISGGIAAAGDTLCLSSVANPGETYFSVDEGATWYSAVARVDTTSGTVTFPKVYGSPIGFANIGTDTMRFSRRSGLGLSHF